MQCLVVGLAGQFGVYVAQVFVRGRIRRMGADCHFKRGASLLVLPLARIQYCQVVVGLGQFRVELGQPGESGNRLAGLVLLGLDQALEKLALGIARLGSEVGIDALGGLIELSALQQLADISDFIGDGVSGACGQQESQHCTQKRRKYGKSHLLYSFRSFLAFVRRTAKRFFGAKLKPVILPNFRSRIEPRPRVLAAFVSPEAQKPGHIPDSPRCPRPCARQGD